MKKQIKYVGIDLGSSSIKVVGLAVDRNGDQKWVEFLSGSERFLSAACESDGKWFFFRKAVVKAEQTGEPLITNIKESLSEEDRPSPMGMACLEKLVDVITHLPSDGGTEEYDFSQLAGVCFGHPAYFDESMENRYCQNMKTALKAAFSKAGVEELRDDQIKCVPEPILAALAYHERHSGVEDYDLRVVEDEHVLVLDFGGFTFDVALMKVLRNGDRLQLSPVGKGGSFASTDYFSAALGKRLTLELCRQIYGLGKRDIPPFDYAVEKAKCEVFASDNMDTFVTDVRDLMFPCENGVKKFRMRYKYDRVRGTRAEDTEELVHIGMAQGSDDKKNINVERSFAQLAGVIEGYLEQELKMQGIPCIHHVLFAGGAAKMRPLRLVIMDSVRKHCSTEVREADRELLMDCPMAGCEGVQKAYTEERYPLSSENAVALGACLVAAGACPDAESFNSFKKQKSPQNFSQAKTEIVRLQTDVRQLQQELDLSRMVAGVLAGYVPSGAYTAVSDIFSSTMTELEGLFGKPPENEEERKKFVSANSKIMAAALDKAKSTRQELRDDADKE